MVKKVLLFLLLLGFFALGKLNAQCPTVFSDGFESGTYLPIWTIISSNYTRAVTNQNPAVGNYCFSQGGFAGHYSGLLRTFTPSTPDYIGVWVKTNDLNANSGYVVIGDANTVANSGIIFFYFSETGEGELISMGQQATFPCTINTWYHLEFKNMNWTTKSFDFYVNNVLHTANFPFRSNASTNIDRVHLYNYSGNATAYYDGVDIGGVEITLTTNGLKVQCPGESNGMAEVIVNGGISPYTYAWSNGANSSLISSLTAGTYSVTVTDSFGCTATDSFNVGSPPPLVSSITGQDIPCNGASTGSINLTTSGGTGGYTYLWSNGSIVEDPTGLPAGTYSVIIYDSNGCMLGDTVTLSESPAIQVSAAVQSVSCHGFSDGAINLSTIGGTPGYSYSWSNMDTTEDLTAIGGGTYTVLVTDNSGCQYADTFVVVEPPMLLGTALVVGANGSSNGSIDLTMTGGTPNYAYAWTGPGSFSASIEDLTGLATGTYIVTVTDLNGCTWTDTFVVNTVVGLTEGIGTPSVTISPNPTQGTVQVTLGQWLPQDIEMQIIDAQGRVVMKEILDQGNQTTHALDLGSLPNGVYLMLVTQATHKTILRVIKQ